MLTHFSESGAKFLFGKLCFVKKRAFPEMGGRHFFGGVGGGGDCECYCMMLLDALEGCSKNPII